MNTNRPTFLFVGNGSYLNRGCEAIVRGTVKILRHAFDDPKFVNANFDVTNPAFMPNESDPGITHTPIVSSRRWTTKWILWQILRRTNKHLANSLYFSGIRNNIKECAAVFSLGGDNYSLDYGIPWGFVNLDNYVLKHNKPLVIWGASVGPFDHEPDFAKDMHRHLREEVTAIFVREKKSLEYLAKNGVCDNVYLMSDPAFLMDPEPTDSKLLGFDMPKEAIGFNISPLMTCYIGDNKRETLVDISLELLSCLRKTTQRPIVLIPHVTSPHSNDYTLLNEIREKLKLKDDIYLVPENINAAQTKWVISKLNCLVASRTHATIAAFSTCVPTVSLAYSTKAYGLNEMLFGHTDFVVSPEDFSPMIIQEKIKMVIEQNNHIRESLKGGMQDVNALALDAGLKFKEIIRK